MTRSMEDLNGHVGHRLPADFMWGYATAAQQIEGAVDEDGRGESIWDRFASAQSSKVQDGSNSNETCDSYHRYKDDVRILKQYKAKGYRFSLSWPRIIPKGGRDDPVNPLGLQYYNNLINELLAEGITPYVTLYHWDCPQALEDRYGGWRDKDEIVQDFRRYAQVCFEAFGDRVKNWITINEPYVVTIPGWFNGDCAPGRSSKRPFSADGNTETEPWIVGHNLMLAHAHAYQLYDKYYRPQQGGKLSITLNGDWVEPWSDDESSHRAAERKMAAAIGWFADPIFLGHESKIMREMLGDRLPTFTPEEWCLVKGSSDFYGCNTYTTNYIKCGGDDVSLGNSELFFQNSRGESLGDPCACPWLVSCPWGFRKHLGYLYRRYKKPILVTEAGFACKDEHLMTREEACNDVERTAYHINYLDNLLKAVIEDGVDVRSYFGWTLMDNWEWAEGYIPRFGVTYVDFKTKQRYPKDSAGAITRWFDKHLSA
ncbi:glycoside hydrolase family 1 protein [Kockovaella imperatae]|uniref:beta-glucosidase n=1 Tax=Kockovaella imperatae TaxID=4999 RepID=A0A1Y1UDP9_9TREE|nr:glycoside hydrolase family 1 protein [Kockovaella imperatae]ORX36109.1 glycoside hydrolase family 1 protein [Kockovaella imperatae]